MCSKGQEVFLCSSADVALSVASGRVVHAWREDSPDQLVCAAEVAGQQVAFMVTHTKRTSNFLKSCNGSNKCRIELETEMKQDQENVFRRNTLLREEQVGGRGKI